MIAKAPPGAKVVSVNVGVPRAVEYNGGTVWTAIWKYPVAGPVEVRGVNVERDDQADRSNHGGVDKAVYAYSSEDYDWWGSELGRRPLEPGTFGDNLTVSGIDLNAAEIGSRWRVGSTVFEVSEPRFPCYKLGIRMGDPKFLKRFTKALRPGAYLRIIEEGELTAGDRIEAVSNPGHGVTIGLFAEAYLADRVRLVEVLAADAISQEWRTWIEERTARVRDVESRARK